MNVTTHIHDTSNRALGRTRLWWIRVWLSPHPAVPDVVPLPITATYHPDRERRLNPRSPAPLPSLGTLVASEGLLTTDAPLCVSIFQTPHWEPLYQRSLATLPHCGFDQVCKLARSRAWCDAIISTSLQKGHQHPSYILRQISNIGPSLGWWSHLRWSGWSSQPASYWRESKTWVIIYLAI